MSKNRFVSDSSRGIFDDVDDVDDNEFLSRVRPNLGYRNDLMGNNYGNQEFENANRQKQQVIETTRDVEQRTLNSTERTLRLLRESENIGAATAEVNNYFENIIIYYKSFIYFILTIKGISKTKRTIAKYRQTT
jgi:synaptosomal-associated protein 29